MRVLNTLVQSDLRATAGSAIASEAAGYDGLLTMENKHDPFLAHAIAAVSTERVELGTSVAIAFPRSPMVVANACWDLQNASRGRFVLGIGPQIRPHNERRFSVAWTAPAPRLREYVQALRAIWTMWERGEKLDFRGKHYTFTLMPPYFMPPSTGQRMVPITLAAVGEHSLRLAGEVADGVRLHGFCTRRYLEEAIVPRLREGMARTGRERAHFEITGGGFVATGRDAKATAQAFEIVRGRVAFYGSTPGYWGVLELHGLGDLGRELNAMSKAGKWNEMAGRVSDDVVHLFAAVGTHREIAARIEERFGGLSDAINLRADSSAAGGDVPPEVIAEIKRIATPFRGVQDDMVTIGLIGLGPGADPHAKSLRDLSGRVTVKAAASRTEARARVFAERFGFPVTTDVDGVIGDREIEAVIVLTPPAAHLQIAERCLRAGKHVLVEKPLELTVESAERLVLAGRAAGRRLGVVLQHRFRPASVRLKAALDGGELGRVVAAWVVVPWWRPQAYYDEPGRGTMARDGGGVLMTQAIHTLDLFRSLVGVREVVAAQAVTTEVHKMETEDFASALIRTGNGAPGSVIATTAAYPGGPERIEIIGTRGTASLVGGGLRLAWVGGGEEVVAAEGATGGGAGFMDFPHDAHRAVIADFLDAIEQDRDPMVTGEEALATQRLIAEIIAVAKAPSP